MKVNFRKQDPNPDLFIVTITDDFDNIISSVTDVHRILIHRRSIWLGMTNIQEMR